MLKTISKIAVAGIVGTTFMTWFMQKASKFENKSFNIPEILGQIFTGNKGFKSKELGYFMHYFVGLSFSASYYLLFKSGFVKPTIRSYPIIATVNAIAGVKGWEMLNALSPHPSKTDFRKYMALLFIAHWVYALFTEESFNLLKVEPRK